MSTILLTSVVLYVLFVVCPLIWLCHFAPTSDPFDRAALAPVVAVVVFAASSGVAQLVPWSFRLQAMVISGVVASSLILLLVRDVRDELAHCLRRAWGLLAPAACCFLAVAARFSRRAPTCWPRCSRPTRDRSSPTAAC